MGNHKQMWTKEEEDALLAGISRYGLGNWKIIRRDPDFAPSFSHRSNIDLKVSTTMMRSGNSMFAPVASSQVLSTRAYSSNSDLPPHQEIGMPSLSPTMTEGNIARWLKKEGEKVSTGEVLCEVETDKATVEMECMEEGFLAKIVKGDGAKEIQVGEIIAITVQEEGDIAKFKDYNCSF